MRYCFCAAILLPLVGCFSENSPFRDTHDPTIGRGRVVTTELPPFISNDIASIRKLADAQLANHPPGFKLFAIYLHPQTGFVRDDYELWSKQNPDQVPFDASLLSYFRPVRGGWEVLEVEVNVVFRQIRAKPNFHGEIGVTVSFVDERNAKQPNAAPANMPATQAALLRLIHNYPSDVFVHHKGLIEFRLTQGGAGWWPRGSPEQYEHEFFTATAPRGKWLWWTILKRPAEWEFIYVDAVSGAAESHCAEPQGNPIRQVAAIPCN